MNAAMLRKIVTENWTIVAALAALTAVVVLAYLIS